MSKKTLEQRIAELEVRVAELEMLDRAPRKKDWRRTIGMFTGDEVMKQIDQEALNYRERDRQKARRRSKGRKVKA